MNLVDHALGLVVSTPTAEELTPLATHTDSLPCGVRASDEKGGDRLSCKPLLLPWSNRKLKGAIRVDFRTYDMS
eukprot:COSAG06_NODE_63497_length_262_cov_0.631902_1_plen_73_part_01